MPPPPLLAHTTCQSLLYTWATSQDTKNWPLFRTLFAPTISINYTAVGLPHAPFIPSKHFVAALTSPRILGNPLLKTQHLIGTQRWTSLDNGRVRCEFQMRVTHLRVEEEGARRGIEASAHGSDVMEFEEVDGEWRIVGVEVKLDWIRGDWEGTFAKL